MLRRRRWHLGLRSREDSQLWIFVVGVGGVDLVHRREWVACRGKFFWMEFLYVDKFGFLETF